MRWRVLVVRGLDYRKTFVAVASWLAVEPWNAEAVKPWNAEAGPVAMGEDGGPVEEGEDVGSVEEGADRGPVGEGADRGPVEKSVDDSALCVAAHGVTHPR